LKVSRRALVRAGEGIAMCDGSFYMADSQRCTNQ